MAEPARRDRIITVIGIAKLLKALVLIAAAVSALATLHSSVRQYLKDLAAGSGRELVTKMVSNVTGYSPHKIELIAALLFIYAALFTVEGVGLLMRKIWAEWLTIIITCSFIPLEVYEVIEKSSIPKAVVLVANLLIAVYLIHRRLQANGRHGLIGWLRARFA
jgi:uncharacterized membrane protein (DUF2068 family)